MYLLGISRAQRNSVHSKTDRVYQIVKRAWDQNGHEEPGANDKEPEVAGFQCDWVRGWMRGNEGDSTLEVSGSFVGYKCKT